MLTVHCPTCNAPLGLGNEMAGQQVRCGGCQEVFLVEAPAPRRSRRDEEDEDDRPRRRPAARREDDYDDEYDDRPRRRSRRRDDDDDYDDEPRRRSPKKRRKKKESRGIPGLAMAAAILFLIWGGLGAILALVSVIELIRLLDFGAPATVILNGLITVIIQGVFSGYLISSGLSILNGQPDNIQSIGIAVLSICIAVMILSVVSLALVAPRFAAELAMIAVLWVLIALSGIIVGGIFCMVVSDKYEK